MAISKKDIKTIRRRFVISDMETREGQNGGHIIEGHAAVFEKDTNIGDCFTETIARGAFDHCDFTDVLYYINHEDDKIPLARSRNNNANSTLQLSIDDIGLKMVADIDTQNNAEARALYSAVTRHDITGQSFAFHVSDEDWQGLDTPMPRRTILGIDKVFDVSAVNEPAYEQTDISARAKETLESAKNLLESKRGKALENAQAVEILKLKNIILGKGE